MTPTAIRKYSHMLFANRQSIVSAIATLYYNQWIDASTYPQSVVRCQACRGVCPSATTSRAVESRSATP